MMRRALATMLVGVGLSFGLAGTATAAPQAAAQDVIYGYYGSLAECQDAGRSLPPGSYVTWRCEQEGAVWVLRISRQD